MNIPKFQGSKFITKFRVKRPKIMGESTWKGEFTTNRKSISYKMVEQKVPN